MKGRYPRPLANSVRRRHIVSLHVTTTGDAVHAAILTAKQRLPNEEKGTMSWKEDLRPPAVWEHFYQLTQIPRPSHHEEQISAFLAKFGQRSGT